MRSYFSVLFLLFVVLQDFGAWSHSLHEHSFGSKHHNHNHNDDDLVLSAVPVGLQNVTLTEGSLFYSLQQINLEYLINLEADNLLYMFRETAGLTNPPGAHPYGGWEASDCELRGHFVGHYMSASARMWLGTGNSTLKAKMDYMVLQMAKCQAKIGSGYLSAFPTSFFDRLEALEPVWAPYYTIHKIMAGLLDQYLLADNNQALNIVIGMAKYFKGRIDKVLQTKGMDYWQNVLNTEWGGMNDVLYSLYDITGDVNYLTMANYFDHYSFTQPLAAGIDDLAGLHANTHIPEVIGSQRGYEVTGNNTFFKLSSFFFNTVETTRSYVTGGNNDYEYWPSPHSLGDTTNGNSQESCTTYNMIKVANHLFQWSAGVSYADYIERNLWGGIIGNMHHSDWGRFIYYQPLGGGFSKPWGDPFNSFWCCYGTMIESHSKLNDFIYFTTKDNTKLFVNQFVSSTLTWGNIQVTQDAGFPNSTTSTTVITIKVGDLPSLRTIAIRVPSWATGQNTIKFNGQTLMKPIPGSYYEITEQFQSGDHIDVYFPLSLSVSVIDDTRERFKQTYGILYGPITLAGIFANIDDSFNITLIGDLQHPNAWITRTSSNKLEFKATGVERTVSLIPLAYVVDEPYTVYFDASKPAPLKSLKQQINGMDYYVRHSGPDFYNNFLYLTPVNGVGQQEQATWYLLSGLVDHPSTDNVVSFEAFHFDPGFYVIHNFGDVSFSTQTATAGPTPWPVDFQQKASFYVRQGLDGSPDSVSFESFDYPGYYLSTYNQVNPCSPSDCNNLCGYSSCLAVYIRQSVDSTAFKTASTFTWVDQTL